MAWAWEEEEETEGDGPANASFSKSLVDESSMTTGAAEPMEVRGDEAIRALGRKPESGGPLDPPLPSIVRADGLRIWP